MTQLLHAHILGPTAPNPLQGIRVDEIADEYERRRGAHAQISIDRLEPTGRRRGGITGALLTGSPRFR